MTDLKEHIFDTIQKQHAQKVDLSVMQKQIEPRKQLSRDMLLMERAALQPLEWPMNQAEDISPMLAAKYPLINMEAVVGMTHPVGINGVVKPRFAMYDTERHGECRMEVAEGKLRSYADGRPPTNLLSAKVQRSVENGIAYAALLFLSGLASLITSAFMSSALLASVGGGLIIVAIAYGVWRASANYTLTTNFVGVIPPTIRKLIRDKNRLGFSFMYIVQEVKDWKVTRTITDPDPLVVGCYADVWYLVARFDVTTAEEYIAKEFTQKADEC